MKNIYTALAAIGLALGTNAQTISYKVDSSFNSNGYLIQGVATVNQAYAGTGACILQDDDKMYLAHHFITMPGTSNIPAVENYITKRKANGSIDSSYANDGQQGLQVVGTTSARIRELFKLNGGGFYAASEATWGGLCTNNDSDTGFTQQFYNSLSYAGQYSSSVQMNDSTIITSFFDEINAYRNNKNNSYSSASFFTDVNTSVGGNIYDTWAKIFPACFSDPNNNIYNTEYPSFFTLGAQKNGKLLIAATNLAPASTQFSGMHIIRTKPNMLNQLDSTFGNNGVVKIMDSFNSSNYTIDWRQTYISAIKVLSDDNILVAYIDLNATANQRYKLIKISNTGVKDNSFGTSGQLAFASYINFINTDAQDNIFIAHDSTILDAYTKNGAVFNINGNSNKVIFSRSNVADIVLVNSSMNNKGDLLVCGYKKGPFSSVINAFGTDAITIKLKRTLSTPNGVSDITDNQKLSVYPNPASNELIVENMDAHHTSIATIYDISGKVQKTEQVIGNKLNIMSLHPGLYVLQINNNGNVYRTKFSKL